MRLPIAVFVALLVPASAAQAGTVALEGTELVFRAEPGAEDRLRIASGDGSVRFESREEPIAAGVGCAAEGNDGLRCPATGVTAIRVLTGDGDDSVGSGGLLPLIVELGPGKDSLISDPGQTSVTVNAGPGNDLVEIQGARTVAAAGDTGRDQMFMGGAPGAPGPYTVDAGPDDDLISLINGETPMTLIGGDGDDRIDADGSGPPVTIVCGPGNDHWTAEPPDRIGDGCAAQLVGITKKSVSRAFREGSLTAAASGSVTFWRRVRPQGPGEEIVARGTFTAQPGPLRVSLKPTRAGRRWLRRDPRLRVNVFVRTRSGGDRGEISFASRIR